MSSLRDELQEYEAFLADVGRCITSWAQIEEKLFEICAVALRAPRKQTAIVYYKTPTIDARLKLVDELVRAIFPRKKSGQHSTPIEKAWKDITDEFDKLIPERNALAHFPLKTILSLEKMLKSKDENPRKLSMRPHRNERLRGRTPQVQEMDAEKLPVHLERVRTLENQLFIFKPLLREAKRKAQP